MMGNQYNKKDITGQKFNMLTAINFVERRLVERKSGRKDIEYYWEFLCDCGNKTITRKDRVTANKKPIISCGCMRNKNKWKGYGEISGSHWSRIKNNAQKRNLSFEISIEDIWNIFEKQKRKCALSGQEIVFDKKDGATTASLDRIDSLKGYVRGNIQWVHKDINISKWNHSANKFLKICRMVTEYSRKR